MYRTEKFKQKIAKTAAKFGVYRTARSHRIGQRHVQAWLEYYEGNTEASNHREIIEAQSTPKRRAPQARKAATPMTPIIADEIPVEELPDSGFEEEISSSSTCPNRNFGPVSEDEVIVISDTEDDDLFEDEPIVTVSPQDIRSFQNQELNLSSRQLSTARGLQITVSCLLRWIELRVYFSKLRPELASLCRTDPITAMVYFRAAALKSAAIRGPSYTTAVFRVTEEELRLWKGNSHLYEAFLSRINLDV